MRPSNFLLAALSVAASLLSTTLAGPLNKRATQVSLISQSYSGSTLSGTVKVQNLAYSKTVVITWANGNDWNSANKISGTYVSGPDSSGYEVWSFSGTASGATQFYITYTVNGGTYYDPGNNNNYQITNNPTNPGGVNVFQPITGLDAWLETEASIATDKLLKNIGSSNNTIVKPGVILASPSRSSPDYFYQWTRDGSTVMEHLVTEYLENGAYLQYIKDWVAVQALLQHTNNPSGGFTSGGLGEPKFNADNTAYTGGWGRPQRDGPALRANTLIKFAKKYIDIDRNYVVNTLWPIIKPDLDYVAGSWNQGGFDLWEEVNGIHFFTAMVQYRALIEGATFAGTMGDNNAKNTYTNQQSGLANMIQGFWNSGKNYFISMQNGQRSGIDCGSLLGPLHGGGYLFGSSHSKVLATLHGLISSFENLYGINQSANKFGWAIGRYPEDIYDGVGTSQAHPWFICTSTSAHVLYQALAEFADAGSISIDSTSINLFKRFDANAAIGTYTLSSETGQRLFQGLFNFADTFLGVVKQWAKSDGSLSEQFNRSNGNQEGANNLTWSYEALLETIKARNAVKNRANPSTTTTTRATTTTPPPNTTTSSRTTTYATGCAATVTVTVTVAA